MIGLILAAHAGLLPTRGLAQKAPTPAAKLSGTSSALSVSSGLPASSSPSAPSPAALAAFDKPGQAAPRDLYKVAFEAFTAGDFESARLYALRIFLDGHRSTNQLDLLGALELKTGRHLIGGEWLRKALVLNPDDANAKKLLARLPPPPRPIPIDPGQLPEHFAGISRKLPLLLARLTTPRVHFDAVLDELARGQFYKALALSEEYEKRYPGVDGTSLTALCAWYLGRMRDAGQLVAQGLQVNPHHTLLLTLHAFLSDTNPETAAQSRPHALYALDRIEEAVKAANVWSAAQPKSAEGLLVKARIALDTLQGPAAKAALDLAAQRDPDHPELDLLRAELYMAARQPQQAGESLKRSLRRGYHLPSVNLSMGLFAAANGQIEEARSVLEESEGRQPFVDRQAWWLFVRLAIAVDRLPQARRALDEWKTRFPMNAHFAAAEALYAKKSGNTADANRWAAQAQERVPGNLSLRSLLSGSPNGAVINLGNAASSVPVEEPAAPSRAVVLPPVPTPTVERAAAGASGSGNPHQGLPSNHAATSKVASGAHNVNRAAGTAATPKLATTTRPVTAKTATSGSPAQPLPEAISKIQGERFSIEVCRDVLPDQVKALQLLLAGELDRVDSLFGSRSEPFVVSFVSPEGMGSRAAYYDDDNERLIISTLCNDVNTLKGLLAGERPDLDNDTCTAMAAGLPAHYIGAGLSHVILAQRAKNARASVVTHRWLHVGLGEIAGGREEVLRDLLQSTQGFLASGVAKLLDVNGVNEALSSANRDGVKLLLGRAQAYLMVAFLLKKAPNVVEGVLRVTKLVQDLGEGKSMKDTFKSTFGITESEFESGWKEAAFWSLKQGVPYEW